MSLFPFCPILGAFFQRIRFTPFAMANLSIVFCRQLARARRDKGMTQSALAEAVGCAQSAISMLESGHAERLSLETVEKIAARLGVAMEARAEGGASALTPVAARGYCPNAACPSCVPYVVQGELLFWPRPQPAAGARRCVYCGELLESRCPACGAPFTEGACCSQCGSPRVADDGVRGGGDPEAWASQRRREIAEWRALLG